GIPMRLTDQSSVRRFLQSYATVIRDAQALQARGKQLRLELSREKKSKGNDHPSVRSIEEHLRTVERKLRLPPSEREAIDNGGAAVVNEDVLFEREYLQRHTPGMKA